MDNIEDKLLAEFRSLHSHLEEWGNLVDRYLNSQILFDINEIVKINPAHRCKEEKTFIFKALYRKKHYKNPLLDIEDKVATRVVVLKSLDIKKIADRIENTTLWSYKVSKEIEKEIDDKPNIFDYQSYHIIVWPNEECHHFSKEIKPYLTCEIQVRTLLQHAFAEISHDSTYKGPYKNDKKIIRHMAKSMALMEATDDYFCRIFEYMSDEKSYFNNWISELITQFREFDPNFNKSEIDLTLTDLIFELIADESININDVLAFVQKSKLRIDRIIRNSSNSLTSQPIFLLIFYLLITHRSILIDKWPLNQEALRTVFHSAGESFQAY